MERETTPSQSEWLIMEVFWANDTPTMTAKEVIKQMQGRSDMSPRAYRGREGCGLHFERWKCNCCCRVQGIGRRK